jgi:hypothetical protein
MPSDGEQRLSLARMGTGKGRSRVTKRTSHRAPQSRLIAGQPSHAPHRQKSPPWPACGGLQCRTPSVRRSSAGTSQSNASRKFERIVIFNDFINDSHASFVHPVRARTILPRRSQQARCACRRCLPASGVANEGVRSIVFSVLANFELPWHPLLGPVATDGAQ